MKYYVAIQLYFTSRLRKCSFRCILYYGKRHSRLSFTIAKKQGKRRKILSGTPVIFNVAYTPYKLKKGSTETEIKAHAEKRAYYDFTGDTNYLRYMTTEGKLTGNESKKFTMLDYLQKSTGVFNGDGMISKDELKEMKRRLKENKGNIWSGFVSFDEENSGKKTRRRRFRLQR